MFNIQFNKMREILKIRNEREAYEFVLRCCFALIMAIFAINIATGQTPEYLAKQIKFAENASYEVATDEGKFVVVNAGLDALAIRCGSKYVKAKIQNLDKAGSVKDQFISMILMANDAMVPYRTYLAENGLSGSHQVRDYYMNAAEAKRLLLKVMSERSILELAHIYWRAEEIATR